MMKDLRAYNLVLLGMVIILLLYTYLCVRFGSVKGILGFTIVMLPAMISIIVYIGDYQLHNLLLSFPVSRRTFVVSKYASTYLVCYSLIALCVLVLFILSLSYPEAKDELMRLLTLKGLLFCVTPITLIVSICYPLLFRFGLRLGVKLVMSSFALLYGMGMVAAEKWIQSRYLVPGGGFFNAIFGLMNHNSQLGNGFYLLALLGILVLIFTSVYLSVRGVARKDIV